MKKNKAPNQYALVDGLLKKHKMAISIVEDMQDHTFKMAIVFNTANKKTGVDTMTDSKIKDLLISLVDDRRW